MIVAIDGPAGVGKSSIAREVANRCGFFYLNSGSFYRAVAWKCLSTIGLPAPVSKLVQVAQALEFNVVDGQLLVDGKDIDDKLHTPEVDQWAAKVSVHPEVREVVNKRLHEIADGVDVVSEGRDITTVVFPDAQCKFFFDALPEIRAQRRIEQHPQGQTFEEVLQKIKERDEIDRNKPVGGLKIASDAVYIDTSYLTIEQVCERVTTAIIARKNDK